MKQWGECPCGNKFLAEKKFTCRCGRWLFFIPSAQQWMTQAVKEADGFVWKKSKTYEVEEIQHKAKQKKGLEKWL